MPSIVHVIEALHQIKLRLETGNIYLSEMISSIGGIEHGATAVLYVSPNGDDTTGRSWDTAFTTINGAYAAAGSDGIVTLINIAPGIYDLDVAGSFTITKKVILKTNSKNSVTVINTHASSTGIFTVNEFCIFMEMTISVSGNNFGIVLNTGGNGSIFHRILLGSTTSTATINLFESVGAYGNLDDVIFFGNIQSKNQTGVHLGSNCSGIDGRNIIMHYLKTGIEFDASVNTNNGFREFEITDCTDAIIIGAGSLFNVFRHFHLESNGTDITDNGTFTSVVRSVDIDTLAGIDGWTEVIYVSPSGDDSDGKSWAAAINSLWEGIQLASTSVNAMTLILCAPAVYDINITGDPDINRNVFIKGIGGTQGVGVSIKNDHASATSVLKFTKVGGLLNLGVDLGTSNNGVIFSGANAIQGRVENVDIVMVSLTSEKVGIWYEDCAFHSQSKVYYIGNPTYAIGLKFDNIQYYIDFDNLFLDCLIGVTSTHADDDYMVLSHDHLHGCAEGMVLTAACSDFLMEEPHFTKNTVNISAVATSDYLILEETIDNAVIKMYPADSSSPVNLTNETAAAGVYGGWQTLVAADEITKPFKIIGIAVHGTSDGNAMYFIDISYGVGNIIIGTIPIRGAVGIAASQSPPIHSDLIPENSIIEARVQTSNGGADNVDVFLQYVEI